MNFFMVNPDDLPEGLREELKRQHDLHHMGHVQAIHESRDFLHGLTREQMVTLRNMISGIIEGTVEDNERGAYALGKITEILDIKHGICGCGIDHDKEAEHLLTKEDEAPLTAEDEPLTVEQQDKNLQDFKASIEEPELPITFKDHEGLTQTWQDGAWVKEEVKGRPTPVDPPAGPARESLLKEYGVLDMPLNFPKVVCAKDCGTIWVSLTDRMRRAPDDCNGCQNKSAWG